MIVIGLNFGDEGKGLTTSFLCSQVKKPLVVRFNGGHQAGHTVVYDDKRHVFSSFGSGTLQGFPTYWSKNCTFYPSGFLKEYKLLSNPVIYVNPLCPVTTLFDITYNRNQEEINEHGSVGVGFGSTIERQQKHYKLFVQDLFHETILIAKLKSICSYYNIGKLDMDYGIELFIDHAKQVTKLIRISNDNILNDYTPIFEGAQGILLDMDFGFFPNVTRSNTTTKNAIDMFESQEVYYVTRSYLTRHGNGFLPDEKKLDLINNEKETNKENLYQGKFRTADLNVELMNYALQCDHNFSKHLNKNLVITCMDQHEIDVHEFRHKLDFGFSKIFVSNGPSLKDIKQIK